MLSEGMQIRLTVREAQVASLVCDAVSNKEIAARLGISEATVKGYLKQLFAALKITRREELIAWCLTNPDAVGQRAWASIRRHARGCTCGKPYCTALSEMRPPLDEVA